MGKQQANKTNITVLTEAVTSGRCDFCDDNDGDSQEATHRVVIKNLGLYGDPISVKVNICEDCLIKHQSIEKPEKYSVELLACTDLDRTDLEESVRDDPESWDIVYSRGQKRLKTD